MNSFWLLNDHHFSFFSSPVQNFMKGLLLLLFFFTFILCQQEPIEGFFSQSGHTNNWAVLVKKNPHRKIF